MFIRNIFSDGMLSAIICIPLILAAIYRFVFPLIVQHYPMLKDFSLYYPILDLFLAYAKIIIAATTLSIVANIDIINVVHNDISDTEQKESSTKETMAANKTGISNLDIRYPFLPSGVIVIYLLIFMSVSSNTTKTEAKQIM